MNLKDEYWRRIGSWPNEERDSRLGSVTGSIYSCTTAFTRFRGLSTSIPRNTAQK